MRLREAMDIVEICRANGPDLLSPIEYLQFHDAKDVIRRWHRLRRSHSSAGRLLRLTKTLSRFARKLRQIEPRGGAYRRSEERRVGKGGVSTCISRWSTDH